VLDRVDVDVIDVTGEVALVTNRMFPVTALPYPALAFGRAAAGDALACGQTSRERRLDQPPAHGKIGIALRQRPDRMQMIGQHDDRVDLERVSSPHVAKRGTECCDMIRQ
jgi:hypothetical protein